jgi:short-subunit dehydrogenase
MNGKVVAITGASSGIGAAAAESIARRGGSVVLIARREQELNDAAARCGENALPVVADATTRDDVKRVVATAIDRFGHIDVWVNNVGRGITRKPSELTDADIDDIMRVNVKSALYGVQEVLPHFRARGSGHIINLREELKTTFPDIAVTLVSPGVVATEFGANAMHGGPDSRSLPNAQDVGEVGEVIAWAIETRRPDVYTWRGAKASILEFQSRLGEDPPERA